MEVDGEQGWFKRVRRRAVDAGSENDGSINRISAIAPHAYFGHQRRLLATTAAGAVSPASASAYSVQHATRALLSHRIPVFEARPVRVRNSPLSWYIHHAPHPPAIQYTVVVRDNVQAISRFQKRIC